MSVHASAHVERLELADAPESARAARCFTADALEHAGADEMVDLAILLVSELATNAFRHAVPPYALTVTIDLPSVEIALEDGTAQPPVLRHPTTSEESGRGLVLVAALASEWGVRALGAGKSTWFTLEADEPEPA